MVQSIKAIYLKKFNKNLYSVKPVRKSVAKHIIKHFHYLKRECPVHYAYGLYKEATLVGVATLYKPLSKGLRHCCGEEYKDFVLELNRLWVSDTEPKHSTSFFLGGVLKQVPAKIIVSFADPKHNHRGVIYQATNWLYTGRPRNEYQYTLKGLNKNIHPMSITKGHSVKELKEFYQDLLILEKIPKKHRYIYLKAKGPERKKLLSKFKFPILPYPKS